MKLKLKNVRLSFPDLFEAGEYEGKRKFGATFLITPGSENDKEVRKALESVAKEAFKDKGAAILKAAMAGGNQKCCYWDGNSKAYDGYTDQMALTAKRDEDKGRPTVLDEGRNPLAAGDGKPYAGCYVDAIVELWAQDNKYGKTVRATLMGVQFRAHGDAFGAGGGVANVDDFEDLAPAGDDDLA